MRFFKYIFKIIFIGYLVSMTLYGGAHILRKAYAYCRGFQAAHFNYENVRRKDMIDAALVGIEARKILPRDAIVQILPQEINTPAKHFYKLVARYNLFPIKVGDAATHILDLTGKMEALSKETRNLPGGARIYAKAPDGFVERRSDAWVPPLGAMAIFALAYSIWLIFIGSLSLSLMNFNIKSSGRPWFLATSYLLGCFVFTALVWLYLLMGGMLERMALYWLGAFLSLGLLGANKLLSRKDWQQVFCFETSKLVFLKKKKVLAFGLILGLLWAAIFLLTVTTPVRDWDAMSHWIMKAKVIFHNRQLIFDYTHFNYYPILWPLHVAIQFALLGGMFDEMAQWSSAVFFLVFIIQFLKALDIMGLTRRIRYLLAIVFICFAYENPFKHYLASNFIIANAENMILSYLYATLCALLLWIKDRRRTVYLMLSVFLMSGLNLSKFEGGFSTLFLLMSLCPFLFRSQISIKQKIWLGLCLLTVLLPLGWIYWMKACGYYSSFYHFGSLWTLQKIFLLVKLNFHYFFINNMFLLFLLGTGYLILYPQGKEWNNMEKFLLPVIFLFILFLGFCSIGWPIHKIVHDFPDAFSRMLMRVAPMVFILLSSRLFLKYKK